MIDDFHMYKTALILLLHIATASTLCLTYKEPKYTAIGITFNR